MAIIEIISLAADLVWLTIGVLLLSLIIIHWNEYPN